MTRSALKPNISIASPKQDVYFSRSVSKAFEIIALLGSSPSPLSLPEVAARTGLTKSFAYRLLRTLETLRQVQRLPVNLFTVPADDFSSTKKLTEGLVQSARDPMRKLQMQFRETVSLAATLGNRIEVLEVLDSPQLVCMTNRVGRILPPHASSLGKVIAAFQLPDAQQRLLANYGLLRITNSTITDELKLQNEYTEIRKNRLAQDDEESIADAYCLAVPITDKLDHVVAGISISMPKSRIVGNDVLRKDIASALRNASETASSAFKHLVP
ncbi:putative Transcriptional regulator KdgR [Candidatus Sulfotelmatomonas gaucii]|uniref:Putative Transcriptional regulator KdgR n=1 Tax=Candidatus Sulfuritelmatomonas gaucii TaxID=2043161 RepID=A0A2N9LC03_9BACT|nr:putative Transcriptional regulator KdgR [Candidatus Sulfotelmatomonas gaucii]